jgi:anaerobic selenocysteine-containing dehydrogenase
MGKNQNIDIIKTTCGMCFSCCGMLGHVKDNEIVKLTGDPHSPVNKGTLCLKGLSALDMFNHPDRLTTPLKRVGARGKGKWQSLSWDDALDVVAKKLETSKKMHGPESTVFILGTTKGLIDTYTERFINAFGSPNIATSGHVCFLPRMFASKVTHGFFPVPDYEGHPECIILWGCDLSKTRMGEHKKILKQVKNGARLFVIDPVKSSAAAKAALHLPIYPGTDLVLALGMIHMIIEKEWVDQDFIDRYCVGFDELKNAVKAYPLERVSQITGLQKEHIKALTHAYATSARALIQWGNAIDHGVNSFGTARAISILRAITGKLDKFGCDIQPLYPIPGTGMTEVTLSHRIRDDIWDRRISKDKTRLPFFKRVLPADIIHTLNTDDPYRLSCVYITGSNPLLTFSNAKNAGNAFKKAAFLVVSDRFLTPTAQLADIILPPATFLEYDSIVAPPYYAEAGVQQKLIDMTIKPEKGLKGKNRAYSDYEIINGLARRLGLEDLFYRDTHDFFDLVLNPSGLTFEEFKKAGTLSGRRLEKKYEKDRGTRDNRHNGSRGVCGFPTPDKKIALYSRQLSDMGLAPLPVFTPPASVSKKYPVMLTSGKSGFFRHSDNRQLSRLRSAHPEPRVLIHPHTAQNFRIKDGKQVWLESEHGKIVQTAKVTENISPGVLCADFGWWFPEKEADKNAWKVSNLNILTCDTPPFSPETGSTNFRNIPVRIKSVRTGEVKINPKEDQGV